MKKSSALKKVTITAICMTAVAFILEIIFVNVLKLSYESLLFSPVRLITLISANLLGGCIFTFILRTAFLSKMRDETRLSYSKVSKPILSAGAALILLDCIKDTFLHPEASTVSALLVSVYLFLSGYCALLWPSDDKSRDKAACIFGAVVAFAFSAFALFTFALSIFGDITYLLSH